MYKLALTTTALTLVAGMASASLSDATLYLPEHAMLVAGEGEGSGTMAYETSGTGVEIAVGSEGSNVGHDGSGNSMDVAGEQEGTGSISAAVGDGSSGVTTAAVSEGAVGQKIASDSDGTNQLTA